MTDREKLLRLIDEVAEGMLIQRCGELVCTINSDNIADHLLAHGVTVKEPQKPLTVEEAAGTNEPVWYEYYKHPIAIPADVVYSHSAPFLEVHKLGAISVLSMREDSYGKTWRCWAEKPTEAERKNAKWEE